jgi:hypothetical protein
MPSRCLSAILVRVAALASMRTFIAGTAITAEKHLTNHQERLIGRRQRKNPYHAYL